jgi:maltose O-acetyltransferase
MSLAGRMLTQVRQTFNKAASSWRKERFLIAERRCLSRLELGHATEMNVPVRSQGRGTLLIGTNNMLGYGPAPRLGNGVILLQPRDRDARIVIGNHNSFSNNVSLVAMGEITIGNRCLIGDQVTILDCDFHEISPITRMNGVGPIEPVVIGDNVWLGSRVMVLKGVTIGENSVVAAMSVVTKSIPPNSIAAGNPARVIRSIG